MRKPINDGVTPPLEMKFKIQDICGFSSYMHNNVLLNGAIGESAKVQTSFFSKIRLQPDNISIIKVPKEIVILLDGFEYFSPITYFVAKLCPIWIHRPSLCRSKGQDDRPKTLTERTFIEEIRFDYLQTHRLKHSKGNGNTLYFNGISSGNTQDGGCLCGSLHCKYHDRQ